MAAVSTEQTDSFSLLMAEVLAGHFPSATVTGPDVELGFAELRVHCQVNSVRELPGMVVAHLWFWLSGGKLSSYPLFASVSGYGDAAREAVITGCCNWACTFGPVLQAALADAPLAADTEVCEVQIHGQPGRLFISGLDRCLSVSGDSPDPAETQLVRQRFANGRWLLEQVLAASALPLLPGQRPSLLSLFVADQPTGRTIEVKVNGCDWPPGARAFADVPPGEARSIVFLRELAVWVPQAAAPPLSRAVLQQTLHGLAQPFADGAQRASVAWRGFRAHQGTLQPPLTDTQLADLEHEIGPLPADYRHFVTAVAAAGAGPGYGLVSPDSTGQRLLAAGEFPYAADAATAELDVRGTLLLAHAGCTVAWLLILRGPCRGQVWVDARGSDGGVRRVADSFAAWYQSWLDACVRDEHPVLNWDPACCSTAHVLSQMLTSIEQKEGLTGERTEERLRSKVGPSAIAISTSGGTAFAAGEAVDPCAGCVVLCQQLGLAEEVFCQGIPPLQARPAPQAARRGLLAKILGRR